MITKFNDFLVENKLMLRDAIYEWLGNSKAVTLSGKPIKLYHGTNTKIDKFDDTKINTMEERGDYIGYGFYFINSETKAQSYARRAVKMKGGTPTIIEAYLKIENPVIISSESDGKKFRQMFGGDEEYFKLEPNEIRNKLISLGYDGLIDYTYGQYAVFYTEQIKIINENDYQI